MKQSNYQKEYFNALSTSKKSKKQLIQIQFERISEFDEKIRTNEIANAYPNIFKSPFIPCKSIKSEN